jgi:hypothetical protein
MLIDCPEPNLWTEPNLGLKTRPWIEHPFEFNEPILNFEGRIFTLRRDVYIFQILYQFEWSYLAV